MVRLILNPKSNPILDNPDFYHGPKTADTGSHWINRYSLPAIVNGEEPFTIRRISETEAEFAFAWNPYQTSRAVSSVFSALPNSNIAEVREVHSIKGLNLTSDDISTWLISDTTLAVQWRLPNSLTSSTYELVRYQFDTPTLADQLYDEIDASDGIFLAGSDAISGASGNDQIEGWAGNDSLIGNAGNDILNGGLGNDVINGGAGFDTAAFNIASTAVTRIVRNPSTSGYTIESAKGLDSLLSIEKLSFTDREILIEDAFSEFGGTTTTYTDASSSIQSVGLAPDGMSFLMKINGVTSTVLYGESLNFSDAIVSTEQLIAQKTSVPVFLSSGGTNGFTLPELFTGPPSLNLQYQLIETADNAVVIGGTSNDFIKVSSTNSLGKAVDGGGGSDVIDGGVGSTFVSGGTNHSASTFFLDGRAPGTSWSTITDFILGSDKATIWGWKQGVSRVSTSFTDFNSGGAKDFEGLTLHFENLLPDNAAPGQTNANLNSITLTGLTLEDFGASSLAELNAQINNKTSNYFQTGIVSDQFGDHGYLFFS